MMKRILCVCLLLCMLLQSLPLSVFADALAEENRQEETVLPESYEIRGFDPQTAAATVISPANETTSALLIAAQYRDGLTVQVDSVEAALIPGINKVAFPDYVVQPDAETKLMLWDSFAGMHPLCGCLTVGAQQLTVEFNTRVENLTVSPRTYPSGAVFGKLPTPVSGTGMFVGWYYDEDLTRPVMESDPVTENTTLYAKWEEFPQGESDLAPSELYVTDIDADAGAQIRILADGDMTEAEVLAGIKGENLSTISEDEKNNAAEFGFFTVTKDPAFGEFILSAKDEAGFIEGNCYRFTLTDERLSFKDHETTARDYYLQIERSEVSNLRLRDDLIFVGEELVDDGLSLQSDTPVQSNSFTLNGATLSIQKNGNGKLMIADGTDGAGGITISRGAAKAQPEALIEKTVVVYEQNPSEELLLQGGDAVEVEFPDELSVEATKLWDMQYRKIEEEVDGKYIYTEAKSEDIVFKPDVFPLPRETADAEKKTVTVDGNCFAPTNTVPGMDGKTYADFGITAETTVDVGDFLAFVYVKDGNSAADYARITKVETGDNTVTVTYEPATEKEYLHSMDLYGSRELSTEELTGKSEEELAEYAEELQLQAEESGFAEHTAEYMATAIAATDTFAQIAGENGMDVDALRTSVAQMDEDVLSLLGDDEKPLYQNKEKTLTVSKPEVSCTISPEVRFGEEFVAGAGVVLTVKGNITLAPKDVTTKFVLDYTVTFEQDIRSEVTMSADVSTIWVLFIPIITEVEINTTVDVYNTTDIGLDVSVYAEYAPKTESGQEEGTQEQEDPQEQEGQHTTDEPEDDEEFVYITKSGQCYHNLYCSYLNKGRKEGSIFRVPLSLIKDDFRPCSRCRQPDLLEEKYEKLKKGLSTPEPEQEEESAEVREVRELKEQIDLSKKLSEDLQKFKEFLSTGKFTGNFDGVDTTFDLSGLMSGGEDAEDAGAENDQNPIPASVAAEMELIQKYQALIKNDHSKWVELYRTTLFSNTIFSFYGIVNVSLKLDFCLYVNLNLAISAKIHHEEAKRYIFTCRLLSGRFKQTTMMLKPEVFSLNLSVMGTVGVKAGVELGFGFNVLSDKLARVMLTAEVGLYFKAYGYFLYSYEKIMDTDGNIEKDSACHGALYAELGTYLDIGLEASALNNAVKKNATLLYQEQPFLTVGQAKVVLGFDTPEEDLPSLQMKKEYTEVVLPDSLLAVEYMDLKTGQTGATAAYKDELKKENAGEPCETYTTEHYTITVTNDDKGGSFLFDPETGSVKLDRDGKSKEEHGTLRITYNQPDYAFNRNAVTRTVELYWDNYGDVRVLSFNTMGGGYVAPIIENANKDVPLPEDPVRPGYTFKGWYTESRGGSLYSFKQAEDDPAKFTVPDENVHLYAHWTANTDTPYTVRYWQTDLYGNPVLFEAEELEGTTDTTVPVSVRTYTGFTAPDEQKVTIDGSGTSVVDYVYSRNDYLYTLEILDQSVYRRVRYGEPVTLYDEHIPGYTFDGWYTDEKYTESALYHKADGDPYFFDYPANDLILNAKFEANEETPYTVGYYTYNASTVSSMDGDATLAWDDRFCSVQLTGKTDTTVTLDKDIFDGETELVFDGETELVTLYDKEPAFSLAYNDANGVGTPDEIAKAKNKLAQWDYVSGWSVSEGKIKGDGTLALRLYYKKAVRDIAYYRYYEYIELGTLEKVAVGDPIPAEWKTPDSNAGETFLGWQWQIQNSDGTWEDCEKPETMPRENLRVYGKWETSGVELGPNEFLVVFEPSGGTYTGVTQKAYTCGGFAIPEKEPTREGHTFDGWYTAPEGGTKAGTGEKETMLADAVPYNTVILYAHWTPNTYQVTFMPNTPKNGTVMYKGESVTDDTVKPSDCTYDMAVDTPGYTCSGYKLDGWYTEAVGGEKITEFKNLTSKDNDKIKLYAHWEPYVLHVMFKAFVDRVPNDGIMYSDVQSDYTCDVSDWYPTDAFDTIRPGYKITGWKLGNTTYGIDEESGKISLNGLRDKISVNDASVTLVADWAACTVHFYSEDVWYADTTVGTDNSSGVVKPKYAFPSDPTRTGYDFDGWFTAAEGGEQITADTPVTITADQTLYAHWTPQTYTVTFVSDLGENLLQGTEKDFTCGDDNHQKTVYTASAGMYTLTAPKGAFDPQTTIVPTVELVGGKTYSMCMNVTGGSVQVYYGKDGSYGEGKSKVFDTGSHAYSFKADETGTYKIRLDIRTPVDGYLPVDTVVTITDFRIYAADTQTRPVTYGSTYGELPTPTREGYAFDGWFTTPTPSDQDTPITADTTVTATKDHTLYAYWTVPVAFGTCDYGLSWTLSEGGTLSITGTGAMTNYSSSSSSSAPWYSDRSSIKFVQIASGVTSIGSHAFYYCSNLTSVTIPSSVTSIGDDAFYNCSSLTSVTIPEGVKSIGDYAFYNCGSLTAVTIPSSVTSIGSYAFYNCSKLAIVYYNAIYCTTMGSFFAPAFSYCTALTQVVIGDGVQFIPSYAFCGSRLTSVTIPEGVTSIGERAFSGCSSLTTVTIPSSVTSIGSYAFWCCSSLTSVTISEGVTSIGDDAFYNCSSLTSVTIPSSVTSIGDYAFYNCSSLPTVTIPSSVTSIGDYAFYGCSSLTSVTIPSSVTSIGDSAFSGCSRLTTVTIQEGVTSIGSYAFSGCSSLTSVTIPSSVTSIGGNAFGSCSSLTAIKAMGGSYCDIDGVLFSASKSTLVCYPAGKVGSYVIPSSVTSIGDSAFSGCSSLTAVTIPSGVTSIGDYAFYNCSRLTSVTIPSGVTSIGDFAFYGCSSLPSIIIPDSVTEIYEYAFCNCTSLTEVTMSQNLTKIYENAFNGCNALNEASRKAVDDAISQHGYEATCLIAGTQITMADGTRKPVEDVEAGDMLLVWDLASGDYGAAPVVFNDTEAERNYPIIRVTFSDGTTVGIATEHGFFDKELCRYVYLDEDAARYIGHSFVNEAGETVVLESVSVEPMHTAVYSPVTYGALCYYVNGMLSVPGGIGGLLNPFDVDPDTMTYDGEAMRRDLEAYKLLSPADALVPIPQGMFDAFNGPYLNVLIGKGLITWDEVAALVERYLPLCD